MKNLFFLFMTFLFFITISFGQTLKDTVVDIDGNVYHTVKIGTQVWMSENLKVIHYRNGDAILNITESIQWGSMTKGAYCNFDNDTNIANIYGRLYNWYAINDQRNIAPKGWNIPTEAEWKILANYLGGDSIAGGKLKEADTIHWVRPNKGADNSSGFTALPGGIRRDHGEFYDDMASAYFWAIADNPAKYSCAIYMMFYDALIGIQDCYNNNIYNNYKSESHSIRCIKD